MRILPERPDPDRESAAGPQADSLRFAESRGNGSHTVPLHDVLPHPGRHQAGREKNSRWWVDFEQGGGRMTAFTNIPKQVEEVLEKWNITTSRRNFLKNSGLL